MKILVTGGLGYIGSHTVVELLKEGYEVIVLDNLSNSSMYSVFGIHEITRKKFGTEFIDLTNTIETLNFFQKHKDISAVIHFAASKHVSESISNPLMYYHNNLSSLTNVLMGMGMQRTKLIFSSSCTVYGNHDKMPLTEESALNPALSPYGHSKQIGEKIIRDASQASGLNAIMLRYFNPIGAHSSISIGELAKTGPTNLLPYITQTAIGLRKELSIYGNDYDTPDGTCVRDYIHVVDVAKAHVLALKRLLNQENNQAVECFNLGVGRGYSVKDIVKRFEVVTQTKINYVISDRRPGDAAEAYSDPSLANKVLGWMPKYDIEEALLSAWWWQQKVHREGIMP